MGTNSFLDITIDDLDESDFGDPISLLEALLKRGSARKQISSDLPKESDCLTASQISQKYNVEVEDTCIGWCTKKILRELGIR